MQGAIGGLDLDFVARVKRYAKSNGTTLGGVVTAIVTAALREGFGDTLDYPAPLPRGRRPGAKSTPKKQRSKNLATQVLESLPADLGNDTAEIAALEREADGEEEADGDDGADGGDEGAED